MRNCRQILVQAAAALAGQGPAMTQVLNDGAMTLLAGGSTGEG